MTGVGVTPSFALNDGLHSVRRQHLERRALRGPGQRVRILAHVERPVRALRPPVVADGLRDRQDVRFGKGAIEREPRWPLVPKLTSWLGSLDIGPAFEVLSFQTGHIDQHLLRRRLARQRRNRRLDRWRFYDTGHGFTFQISAAYSAMVRSLENFPELRHIQDRLARPRVRVRA